MNFGCARQSADCSYLDRKFWVLGLARRKFLGELAGRCHELSGSGPSEQQAGRPADRTPWAFEGVTNDVIVSTPLREVAPPKRCTSLFISEPGRGEYTRCNFRGFLP